MLNLKFKIYCEFWIKTYYLLLNLFSIGSLSTNLYCGVQPGEYFKLTDRMY